MQINISRLAKLSQLTVSASQASKLSRQFTETLTTVSKLEKLNTQKVNPTSQVTGLSNVTRPDQIDSSRILSQDQALQGTSKTHNGFFVVPVILNQDA